MEQWKRDFICKTLHDIEADCVIELGSGWRHRLVDLWRSGAQPSVTHYACELTQNGVECSQLLQTLYPEMSLTPVQFNMLEPDLGFVEKKIDNPVVFMVHAIEQIPEISPRLFDALIKRFPQLTVVHFEPVTFQLPGQIDANPERYAHDVEQAQRVNQNTNLYDVLTNHPYIEINDMTPAAWQASEGHSTSIIRWHAATEH